MSLFDGWATLGTDINKAKDADKMEQKQGAVSPFLPELELDMKDDQLISLKRKWESIWMDFSKKLAQKQKTNEEAWLGKNRRDLDNAISERPMADNVLFEAIETFIPVAAQKNPEPMVESDDTPEGQSLAAKVQKMLMYLSDRLGLKLSLKRVVRFWSLYYLGVMKIGWSAVNNEITTVVLRPQKLIMDPNATIINGKYTGEFIGEYRKESASKLADRFPKKKKEIESLAQDKMGTELQYIEWWTNDMVFWTINNIVLDKSKNPHWNYDQEGQGGKTVKGKNHFPRPQMPYTFLSVFNVGQHPVDDTNLVEQTLALQDLISKRNTQIDKNADNTNGGVVVSGDHFTKEQAFQVSTALRKGNAVWVPQGDVNRAFKRDMAPPLPAFVYQSLQDYRDQLKGVFGIKVLSGQVGANERTARQKIAARQQEIDRIGGGVSEFLEQMSDVTFNWFVQMMYVYYTDQHTASVIGPQNAQEFITLKADELDRKLIVSVKEGSMLPKDALMKRTEAIELYQIGALDPITLFERLEFPNPKETAKLLFQWKANPQSLFPDVPLPQPPPGEGEPQEPSLQNAPLPKA